MEEREVLILSNFYGLGRDEIASVIGRSVEVVDTLMRHAIIDLRRALTSDGVQNRAA
jgi:DNA-directed RNA polymerase specialized sigma24 family protein